MVTIRLEGEAVFDVIEQMMVLHEALASRHGEAFRALERRIDAMTDSNGALEVQPLDSETLIATPPQEWTAILQEGRRLGVI